MTMGAPNLVSLSQLGFRDNMNMSEFNAQFHMKILLALFYENVFAKTLVKNVNRQNREQC